MSKPGSTSDFVRGTAVLAVLAFVPLLASADDVAEVARVGDRLEYVIEARRGESVRSWRVWLELAAPEVAAGDPVALTAPDGTRVERVAALPEDTGFPCRVTLEEGRLPFLPVWTGVDDDVTLAFAPARELRHGFLRFAERLAEADRERSRLEEASDRDPAFDGEAAFREWMGDDGRHEALQAEAEAASRSLFCFLSVVAGSKTLEPLRERLAEDVVKRPSIFRLAGALITGGVDLSLNFPLSSGIDDDGGRVVPYVFRVANRVALEGAFVVAAPAPPLLHGAGFLELRGTHPERDDRSFTIRLVDRRTGEGPAVSSAEGLPAGGAKTSAD